MSSLTQALIPQSNNNSSGDSSLVKALTNKPSTQTISTIQPQQPQNNIFSNIGNFVGNVVKGIENVFKPVQLSTGTKLTLSSTKNGQPDFSNSPESGTSAQMTVTPQSLKQQEKSLQNTKNINNTITNLFPQTTKDLNSLNIDPFNFKADPKQTLSNYAQTTLNDYIKNVLNAKATSKNALKQFKDTFKKQTDLSEKIGKGLQTTNAVASGAISPLTALFSVPNKTPIIGTFSKLLGIAFIAIGEGTVDITNRFMDTQVKNGFISQKTANNIKLGLGEIVTLAVQLKAGKALDDVFSPVKRGELQEKFGIQGQVTIEKQATDLAKQQKSVLPEGEHPPQTIIDHVVNTDQINTPDGQKMMKIAGEAQKQGANINVEHPVERQVIPLEKPESYQGVKQAFATVTPDGKGTLHVELEPSVQKSGQGTAIVKQLEQQLMDKGVDQVKIKAFTEAQGFWEKQGYIAIKDKTLSNRLISMEKTLIPKKTLQLEARNPQGKIIQGEGFTMTDKADKQSVLKMKSLNDYQKALNIYNQNSTPRNLKVVQNARITMNTLLESIKSTKTQADNILNPIIDKISDIIKENEPKETTTTETNKASETSSSQSVENRQNTSATTSTNEGAENIKRPGSENVKSSTSTTETVRNRNTGSESQQSTSTSARTSRNGEELKVSKVAKRIEADALTKGSIEAGLDKLSGYTPQTFKEQIKININLVNNHFDDVKSILRGKKSLPKEYNPSHFIQAVREYLKNNPNDIETLIELSKSSIVSKTSEAAQILGAARTIDTFAPDKIIRQLSDERKAFIEKQFGKSIANIKTEESAKLDKSINNTIAKNSGTKSKLAEFIKGIQC